ncbi:hypothetical protein N7520_007188 [Penicillium odoratum]|uniref:uncharacterized protein n=1 Tax=Penicillium odoratum TaxID=1167516 RepID=UPI002546C74C|nr:uncharacterized protein N7520_007188 [Penicillium odoratum]KAJ5760032.1 hypothetical protein N7520_007188 [Penicillium odoratum]
MVNSDSLIPLDEKLLILGKQLLRRSDYLEINTERYRTFTRDLASLQAGYDKQGNKNEPNAMNDWLQDMKGHAQKLKMSLEQDEAEVNALEDQYQRGFP